jgi:hypothetical protein
LGCGSLALLSQDSQELPDIHVALMRMIYNNVFQAYTLFGVTVSTAKVLLGVCPLGLAALFGH